MIRLAILALVLVSSCGVVLGDGEPRDLENECAEFKDGLLSYCVGLDLPPVDPECGGLPLFFFFSSFPICLSLSFFFSLSLTKTLLLLY